MPLGQYNINGNSSTKLEESGRPPSLPAGIYAFKLHKKAERETQSRDMYLDLTFFVVEPANGAAAGALHQEALPLYLSTPGKARWRTDEFFTELLRAIGQPGVPVTDQLIDGIIDRVTIMAEIEVLPGRKSKEGKEYGPSSRIRKMWPSANTAPQAVPMQTFVAPAPQPSFQMPPQVAQPQYAAPPVGYQAPPPQAYTPPAAAAPPPQQAGSAGPTWMYNQTAAQPR